MPQAAHINVTHNTAKTASAPPQTLQLASQVAQENPSVAIVTQLEVSLRYSPLLCWSLTQQIDTFGGCV